MSAEPMILNLDELVSTVKSVTLNGISYAAKDMTVEDYIKRVQRARDMGDTEATKEQKIKDSIEFLGDIYPTMGADLLNQLSLRQLSALITFTLASPEDIAKGVDASTQEAQTGNA